MERWGENVENCRSVSRVNRFRFIKGRSRAMIFELSSNIPCMARNHGRRGVCHYAVCNRFRVATKFIEEFLCGASLSLSLFLYVTRSTWKLNWTLVLPYSFFPVYRYIPEWSKRCATRFAYYRVDRSFSSFPLSLSVSFRTYATFRARLRTTIVPWLQVLDIPIGERVNWLRQDIPRTGRRTFEILLSQTARISNHSPQYENARIQNIIHDCKLNFRSASELFA